MGSSGSPLTLRQHNTSEHTCSDAWMHVRLYASVHCIYNWMEASRVMQAANLLHAAYQH
jgi:hypothetical protein